MPVSFAGSFLKHIQFLMLVWFHAAILIWEAVALIRDDEPQYVTSCLTDFLQTYAAVLVQAGYHVSVMEGLTVLHPPAQCVQKIADVFLGKVQHHLEVQVVVFLHSMRVCIAKIWIWPGIVKNVVYDPVYFCVHTEPPLCRQHL